MKPSRPAEHDAASSTSPGSKGRNALRTAARWAVLAAALACVAIGWAGGEQLDVYWKAATVCLECIGIG